jgi:hypothetical protein
MSAHDIDDLMDEELEGLNDPLTEHLPEPPTLTGRGSSVEMFGETAYTPVGRATSPPLFAQASLFPQCQQLRLWQSVNGQPSGLGTIPATATEEDLIMAYPEAMPGPGEVRKTFIVRPLDANGRELGQEIPVHISEHHAMLQQMRRGVARGQAAPMMPQGMAPEQLGLLNRTMDLSEYRARQAEEALKSERERLLERDHQLAQERVDLAANAAQSVQAMSERMLESDQNRHQQAVEAERARNEAALTFTSNVFGTQIESMRADREMMAERARADREADRSRHEQSLERLRAEAKLADAERDAKIARETRDYEARIRREADDWQRRMDREREESKDRREREDAARKAEDAERQRVHELKLKEMELSATRDREHAERMMQLSTQKQDAAKGTDLIALVQQGKTLLDTAGIDLKDIVGMVGGGGGGAWMEMFTTLAEQVGGVAEKALEAKAAQARRAPAPPPPGFGLQQLTGPAPWMNPAQQAQPPWAGVTAQQPQYVPGPGGVPVMAQQWAPSNIEGQAVRQEPLVTPPPAAPPAPEGPKTTLGLKAQKTARAALRELVGVLRQSPEEDWGTAAMIAIGNEMTIYHYAQDVSVQYALQEAQCPPEMITQLIAALKENPNVPADLRYE